MDQIKTVVAAVVVSLAVCFMAIASIVGDISEQIKAVPTPSVQVEGTEDALGGISLLGKNPVGSTGGVYMGGNAVHLSADGLIAAGSNQASWRNQTGRKVVVDYAEMRTTGTASSSFDFYVATSSSVSSVSFDYSTAGPFSELIDAKRVATSSDILVVNSIKDSGTNGRGAIEVGDGEYVWFVFRNSFQKNDCDGSFCESATSTNRGFNVRYLLKYHYIP